MRYIRKVEAMLGHRLRLEMESGSTVTVDLESKLHTAKYAELKDEALFRCVSTDGDYVIWGAGRMKVTVQELLDVVLLG